MGKLKIYLDTSLETFVSDYYQNLIKRKADIGVICDARIHDGEIRVEVNCYIDEDVYEVSKDDLDELGFYVRDGWYGYD